MSARWHAISAAVRGVLIDDVSFEGPLVEITRQLGPALWPDVKVVLKKLGAVHLDGTSVFEFKDEDARVRVTEGLAAGRVMHAANAAGFVATPCDLAEEVVRWYGEAHATVGDRARVLEPSAGTGSLVRAILKVFGATWVDVTAVEYEARRARRLSGLESVNVLVETFETYAERARLTGDTFDLVVMNPPFAVPGKPTLWVDHLFLAWSLLAPGGRLVAILPGSVLDARRKCKVGKAHDLVRLHGDGLDLGDDAFAESGVRVPAAAVWLDRPLQVAAPVLAPVRHPALFQTYTGDEFPVAVPRPYVTRAAARATPVQVWHDWWRRRDRVLRCRAECVICSRPLWGFDDGENDPRGVLGDSSAGFSMDPYDDGWSGMSVGACPPCANTYELEGRAHQLASGLWNQSPEPAPPAPEPIGQLALEL